MVNTEGEPILGQGQEVINISAYNNTLQTLKRHYYINVRGDFDHDIADFILKKGDYTNTYIAIETEGIPDGVTLKLVDENLHQLYSPVDANNNWITTACSITVGESDIIPLPAQFNNQLSSHVPFAAGTYNWKLIFVGNNTYKEKEIPLEVEIRDFKVWDILTPEVYPNEDIKVKLKTYADTYYPNNYFNNNLLTTNATYDASTGIITYPNQDITDLSIGKHMQVINQSNNCFIDYEVKNPIEFYHNGNTEYGSTQKVGYIVKQPSLVDTTITPNYNILINEQNILTQRYGGGTSPLNVHNVYTNFFPPGVYHCIIPTISTTNGQQYICEGTFTIATENCALQLINNNFKVDLSIPKLSAGQGTGTLTINLYDEYNTAQNIESSVIDICGPNYYYERILGSELQNNSITKTLDAGEYFVIIPNCNIPLDKILQDDSVYKQKVTVSNNDTTNCNLYLHYESGNVTLTSKYLFNQSTAIPNAKMGLLKNGTLVQTGTTDSNGEVEWNITSYGSYQSVAIDDYDNSYLLYSNYESVTTYNSRISLETDSDYYIVNEETIQLTGKLVKDDNTPLPLKEIIIDDNGMALKDIIKFNIDSTIIYVDDETIEGHITNISDSENVDEKEIIIEVNNDTV